MIQLNRKFQFLENSRVCVDLCAAPGGWLQIASEYMPVSSVIVGVDLAPITPIRNVITFQSDITTEECSKTITSTLAGWKADVVLHDGAPNVGRNWLHDAYSQNVLVVNALKIACSHLTKGGWFITKIFRSADYTSLIWVFGKLFGKVHATKPQASRQESAEIFVVCQNYKDPENIDPRFFDPSALFADISDFDENLKKQKADLLKPANKIKKSKAIGYEDIEALKLVSDVDFVTTNNHMEYLAQCHQIKLNNSDILAHPSTDDEIKECCKDLRVLGRKDLLKLLKWRRDVRKDLTAKLMSSNAAAISSNGTASSEQMSTDEIDYDQLTIADDDDEQEPELCLDDIERMQDEEKRKEEKRFKRIEEKRRLKLQERAKYGMDNQGDVLIEEELDLFNLKSLGSEEQVGKIDDVEPDQLLEEIVDVDDIAAEKRAQRRSVTFSREPEIQYFDNDKDYESDEDSVDADADKGPIKEHETTIQAPKSNLRQNNKSSSGVFNRLNSSSNSGAGLLTDLMDINQSKIASASRFFDEEIFGTIDLEQEFETDLVEKMTKKKDEPSEGQKQHVTNGDVDKMDIDNLIDQNMDRFDDASSDSGSDLDDSDDDGDSSHDGEHEDLGQGLDDDISDTDEEDEVELAKPRKRIKLGPEGLAMASMMVSSEKNRKMLEDEGWNRFSQGDSHLAPKWFREDEEKHCRRNLPVTPELVKEYKQRLREIDAKPIKKVMQAKARKKRRAMKKMDRVRKKVEAITSNEDMTQRDRIQQVRTVYKNATKTKKKEVKLVVGRKGLPTKKPGKAKYKMVDSRMKKDLRAKQRRESKSKGGKSKSGKGRGTGRRPPPQSKRDFKSRTNKGGSSKKSAKSGGHKRSSGGQKRKR